MLKKEDLVIVSQNSTILEVLESMNSAGMQM